MSLSGGARTTKLEVPIQNHGTATDRENGVGSFPKADTAEKNSCKQRNGNMQH